MRSTVFVTVKTIEVKKEAKANLNLKEKKYKEKFLPVRIICLSGKKVGPFSRCTHEIWCKCGTPLVQTQIMMKTLKMEEKVCYRVLLIENATQSPFVATIWAHLWESILWIHV